METAFLLSLDVASRFSSELRIEEFYSLTLRDLARCAVREGFLSRDEESRDPEAVEQVFIQAVTRQLDRSTLKAIRSWQKMAFPKHSEAMRLWLWTVLLQRLLQTWDETGLAQGLPLSGSDMAWARIRMRDYLSHLHNVSADFDATQDAHESDWDREVETSAAEWFYIRGTVVETAQRLYSRTFWTGILTELPTSEIKAIEEWGRSLAKQENMPLRYARLPKPILPK